MERTEVWIVTDRDYDNDWIVTAYRSRELAEEHVKKFGGTAENVEIQTVLHEDDVNERCRREYL